MRAPVRWGVAGTGRVAAHFARDLGHAPGAERAAVSSRDAARARAFAAEHGFARAHEGVAALAEDAGVDVVYLAGVNTSHYADARCCLERGRPVVVEKPFTMDAREAGALADLARERGVFLMEGMWSRFFPAMEQARVWIQDGRIGAVRSVRADIGHAVPYDPANRLFDPALGGGALLDLGVYALSLVSWCGDATPRDVAAWPRMNEAGTDSACAWALGWTDGRLASGLCAVDQHLSREAVLYGERGRIIFPDAFWRPVRVALHRDGREPELFEGAPPGRGFAWEAAHVMDCLRAGFTESPIMPLRESVAVMRLLDRLRAAWPLSPPRAAG
jgi:predicted dehydrogenase